MPLFNCFLAQLEVLTDHKYEQSGEHNVYAFFSQKYFPDCESYTFGKVIKFPKRRYKIFISYYSLQYVISGEKFVTHFLFLCIKKLF